MNIITTSRTREARSRKQAIRSSKQGETTIFTTGSFLMVTTLPSGDFFTDTMQSRLMVMISRLGNTSYTNKSLFIIINLFS